MATNTISDEEKQLIQNIFSNTSPGVLVQKGDTDLDAFILKSYSYYDLQEYILFGLGIEGTTDMFNTNYPEAKLKALTDLETGIYAKCRTAITRVHSNCGTFNKNSLGKFVLVTGQISNYCDNFARYVGGTGLLRDLVQNLSEQIDPNPVLVKRASYLCTLLSEASLKVQNNIDDLVKDLKAFSSLTAVDKEAVDYLVAQFFAPKTGQSGPFEFNSAAATDFKFKLQNGQRIPRTQNGQFMQPYGQVIGTELLQLRDEAVTAAKEARAADDDYHKNVVIASTTVTYAWCGIGGVIAATVVASIYGKRATDAKEKYEQALARKSAADQKVVAMEGCLSLVTQLTTRLDNLETRITRAVEALNNMSAHFAKQSSSFSMMGDKMRTVLNEIGANEAFIAVGDMDMAIQAWANVKTLAADYVKYSAISYTNK